MVNRIYLQLFYFGTLSVNWDFWFSRILQPEIILNNRKFAVAQMKAYKNDNKGRGLWKLIIPRKGNSCELCSMRNVISVLRQKLLSYKDYKLKNSNFTSKNATWVIRDLVVAVGGRTVLVFTQFLPDFCSPRGFIIFPHYTHFCHSLKQTLSWQFIVTFRQEHDVVTWLWLHNTFRICKRLSYIYI